VAFIAESFPFSGNRERLARARSRPDALFVRPSGLPQGVAPDSDASKEMALGKAAQIFRPDFSDVSSINLSRRDHASLH